MLHQTIVNIYCHVLFNKTWPTTLEQMFVYRVVVRGSIVGKNLLQVCWKTYSHFDAQLLLNHRETTVERRLKVFRDRECIVHDSNCLAKFCPDFGVWTIDDWKVLNGAAAPCNRQDSGL